MFVGHRFVKLITKEWVLDLDTNIGYKVSLKEQPSSRVEDVAKTKKSSNRHAIKLKQRDSTDIVTGYTEAFKADMAGAEINFTKYIPVPVKILNEASLQITKQRVMQ